MLRWLVFLAASLASASAAFGGTPAMIEVQAGKETLQGRVAAHASNYFWLMGQDGRLFPVDTDRVSKFRQVSPQFRSWSSAVMRDQLRREFGKPFEIAGTRHYLVCAPGEAKARQYAETFEELFRSFQLYFSVRGFQIAEPEFPLVAIVFPDREAFVKYSADDKVHAGATLRGYYLTTSNRVALYEGDHRSADVRSALDSPLAWGSIEGSLKDTMNHEGTHQVAFNTGLHTRIGLNPKWVVEGLATVFEAPGIRNSGANQGPKSRINIERLMWFNDFAKSRRKPKSLEAFLASDEMFGANALDAYSQAWAFSFFLVETRPRPYADYLRTIATRNPLQDYPAEERIADFKKTVSKDLTLLEAEFLRFIGGIK